MTALKDAVDVFMDYIREVDTNDRVALVVYNASNGNAKLEIRVDHRPRPGADDRPTTASGSLPRLHEHRGRHADRLGSTLVAQGRTNAFKMIVLMTDGVANWNNGGYNIAAAKNHVLSEAVCRRGTELSGRGDQPGCRSRHGPHATGGRHHQSPAL